MTQEFNPRDITLAKAFMAGHHANMAQQAQAMPSMPSDMNTGSMVKFAGTPAGRALIEEIVKSSRPKSRGSARRR